MFHKQKNTSHHLPSRKPTTKAKKKKTGMHKELHFGNPYKVKTMEVVLFTKHLSLTLRSGIPLPEGLRIMQDQVKGNMKNIVKELVQNINQGMDFNSALDKFPDAFTEIYRNMIKTGEESGTLEDKLERLSEQLKKLETLKKKIKSAMIYPMSIFIAVTLLGLAIAMFVLPKILPLFSQMDMELPFTTKVLIFVANVFQDHGLIITPAVLFAMWLFFWILKRKWIKPYTHRLILKLPTTGPIAKKMNLEKFTYTLGSLLESGLTIDKALETTSKSTGNVIYRTHIEYLIPAVLTGQTLKQALEKYPDLFPPITTKMIGVGEETGTLGSSLTYLAEFYEEEVDDVMSNLSSILEPVMLIFIGIMVGLVAMSILSPIYAVTGNSTI